MAFYRVSNGGTLDIRNARCIAKGTYSAAPGTYANVTWTDVNITKNASYFIAQHSQNINVGDVLKDIYLTIPIYTAAILSIDNSNNVFFSYYGDPNQTAAANPSFSGDTLTHKWPGSSVTIFLALFKIE